jgi:hypothetical protein
MLKFPPKIDMQTPNIDIFASVISLIILGADFKSTSKQAQDQHKIHLENTKNGIAPTLLRCIVGPVYPIV